MNDLPNDPLPGDATPPAASSADELLIAYLGVHDAACPLCGYNLRGLTTPRCPECGRSLRLAIGLTEPELKAWIVLAVGTFGAAGAGLLFGALVLNLGWPPYMALAGDLALLFFLVSPLMIWPVIASRRKFMRLAPTAQWILAVSAVAVGMLCILLLTFNIR